MPTRYAALHYPGDLVDHLEATLLVDQDGKVVTPDRLAAGDVTAVAEVPRLLGDDPFGRPYEVLDAELITGDPWGSYTRVHLGPASVEALRAHHAVRTTLVEEQAATRMARLRFLALFVEDPAAAEVSHLAATVAA